MLLNQLIAGFLLAEGLVFGGLAYFFYRRKASRLGEWQKASGEVVEVKETDGGVKHPVICYQTTTGAYATFQSRFGSSNWKIQPGDRVELFVNPRDPSEVEVVNFMAQWGLPLVLAVCGIGSLVSAPILFFLIRR